MLSVKDSMLISEYHRIMESDKWCRDLPKFSFDSDWEVKIIPPFCGAVIRFCVFSKTHPEKHNCSIYFDAYGELGCVNEPYWEVYDGEDCSRFLLGEEDEMMNLIRNHFCQ